jgi:hypothetical protein
MNDEQATQRGLEARQVIENPAYRAAMDLLKAEVVQAWKACPVRDKEGQLVLLQLAKLTDKFDGILTGMVETGRYSQRRIEEAVNDVRSESGARKLMRRVL